MNAPFLFLTCQAGMESSIKQEVPRSFKGAKFAFSRRGILTFRLPEPISQDDLQIGNSLLLARTIGLSIGGIQCKKADDQPGQAIKKLTPHQFHLLASQPQVLVDLPSTPQLLQSVAQQCKAANLVDLDSLHLWARDGLVSAGHFERGVANSSRFPAVDQLAILTRDYLIGQGILNKSATCNYSAAIGQSVLDLCLIEPDHFWLGWHVANSQSQRWPGGVLPLMPTPAEPLSRAYYKVREAVCWASLPVMDGQMCAEIGAAPGGSCQWLLEQGLNVIGIDPADILPPVSNHPNFVQIRRRGLEVRRRDLAGIDWLLSDANTSPNFLLNTVEDLLKFDQIDLQGLILTLKLPDLNLLAHWNQWKEQVVKWGYKNVRGRQLVFNRQEVCLVATKS